PANRHSPSWLRSSSARGRAGSSVKQVTTRTCGACTGNGAHRKRRRTMTDHNPDIPAAAPPPGWGEKEPEKKHTKLRRRFALGLAVFRSEERRVGKEYGEQRANNNYRLQNDGKN